LSHFMYGPARAWRPTTAEMTTSFEVVPA
jgi:hypothetical protein